MHVMGWNMSDVATFRVRFRFRVQKKLNINEQEYRLSVGGHEAVMSSPLPETPIKESEWLVMNVRGFNSEGDARNYANKIKSATEISSIATRLGVDTGIDLPTSGLFQALKDHAREQEGLLIRDNVHGIDVFLDDPNVRIFQFSATGTVLAQADPFVSDLALHFDAMDTLSQNSKDVILLLNYALTRTGPVAQIVFAVSAVEMLGQSEDWTLGQKQLLEQLALNAEAAIVGSAEERSEVSDAIRRSVHKIGLRQGVMRLLDVLGLEHLKKEWDDLYGRRSTLVHGLAPKPGTDYSELAFKTVSLCGYILLQVISRDVSTANLHIDTFYN
jgi:hypothetical protein